LRYAKYADALRRISLSLRNSLTSRSRSFSRSRSSEASTVGPARWLTSLRRHRRSVSAVQPIFEAIDVIASYSEP
jgi:hypothetical protein